MVTIDEYECKIENGDTVTGKSHVFGLESQYIIFLGNLTGQEGKLI